MSEKLVNIVVLIVVVAGMAWFLSTRPTGNKSTSVSDCYTDWDGRSNRTVCN